MKLKAFCFYITMVLSSLIMAMAIAVTDERFPYNHWEALIATMVMTLMALPAIIVFILKLACQRQQRRLSALAQRSIFVVVWLLIVSLNLVLMIHQSYH
jgi:hypothetical protein